MIVVSKKKIMFCFNWLRNHFIIYFILELTKNLNIIIFQLFSVEWAKMRMRVCPCPVKIRYWNFSNESVVFILFFFLSSRSLKNHCHMHFSFRSAIKFFFSCTLAHSHCDIIDYMYWIYVYIHIFFISVPSVRSLHRRYIVIIIIIINEHTAVYCTRECICVSVCCIRITMEVSTHFGFILYFDYNCWFIERKSDDYDDDGGGGGDDDICSYLYSMYGHWGVKMYLYTSTIVFTVCPYDSIYIMRARVCIFIFYFFSLFNVYKFYYFAFCYLALQFLL